MVVLGTLGIRFCPISFVEAMMLNRTKCKDYGHDQDFLWHWCVCALHCVPPIVVVLVPLFLLGSLLGCLTRSLSRSDKAALERQRHAQLMWALQHPGQQFPIPSRKWYLR
jgi:hypothetical protein